MPELYAQSEDLTINSLVTKVVATVFVGTFATALLVGWIAIQSTRDFVERSIEERYPRAVELAAQASATWLAAARARLEHAVAELDRAPSDAELADALEKARGFEGIRVCGGGGAELAAGLAPPCPRASRDADAPLGWLATRREDGTRQPAIATPLVAAERSPRFAIASFERKRLVDLLGVHRPHPDALMLLASRSGEVLAGIGAGELPKRVDLAFASPASDDSSTASAGSIWRRAIRMAHPIAGTPWHVAFEVPSSVVYSPLLVLIRRILLIDLAALIALSAVAYRITAKVLAPIEALSIGARRVAEGDFSLAIPDTGSRDEIGVLTGAFNHMLQRVRDYQAEIQESYENLRAHNVKLQQANELLEQLSITDGLTKLHNHRFFQDQLTREIRRATRSSSPLALLLIDIDDFKSLNDRFGHAAGDELLYGLATIMNSVVRSSDLLVRYGGEEFAVLAPATDAEGAYQLAEKLRTAIAESSFIVGESMRLTRVTVSVGVAVFQGDRKKFFDDADRALYRAKAAGKNCVMCDDRDAAC